MSNMAIVGYEKSANIGDKLNGRKRIFSASHPSYLWKPGN